MAADHIVNNGKFAAWLSMNYQTSFHPQKSSTAHLDLYLHPAEKHSTCGIMTRPKEEELVIDQVRGCGLYDLCDCVWENQPNSWIE